MQYNGFDHKTMNQYNGRYIDPAKEDMVLECPACSSKHPGTNWVIDAIVDDTNNSESRGGTTPVWFCDSCKNVYSGRSEAMNQVLDDNYVKKINLAGESNGIPLNPVDLDYTVTHIDQYGTFGNAIKDVVNEKWGEMTAATNLKMEIDECNNGLVSAGEDAAEMESRLAEMELTIKKMKNMDDPLYHQRKKVYKFDLNYEDKTQKVYTSKEADHFIKTLQDKDLDYKLTKIGEDEFVVSEREEEIKGESKPYKYSKGDEWTAAGEQ